ncbi:MAG: RNase adapter RapZ [Lachnospiraceae bacterium]|nr:RNase adapter RapZ [Lachnospiraceae bacterium]
MRFVVVTGMSGGGKRTAMKMLEDVGFYCVDNLPIKLIDRFVELFDTPGAEMEKVALGLDVRADQHFLEAETILERLRDSGYSYEILFMDADDRTLIKRYKESRRMHPLHDVSDISIEQGIAREREILAHLKSISDYVIDTSKLLTRDLKEEIDRIFVNNEDYNGLMVNIVSFGFKYGIPVDADLVFDVRFLPNPFYIDELKSLTGNDEAVRDFVMSYPISTEFLDKLVNLLTFLIPGYINEGKHQLVIGIGCTGGQHRSVTLANELYLKLKDAGSYGLTIMHRDTRK